MGVSGLDKTGRVQLPKYKDHQSWQNPGST